MLTNPAATTPAAQTDGDRPSLRLATRATPAAEDALPTTAVRITHEVSGRHAEWRRTLETVKTTLAGLEQACESAIDAQQAEVAGLIDTLVQNAAAEATAIAAQTREQAQIEINALQQVSVTLQSTVETLQSGLQAEQETVKRLSAQLDVEAAARARAESERDELQRQCQGRVAAAEAQAEALRASIEAQKAELALARQQLEAAVAERTKLANTFKLVQRALALNPLENIADAAEADGGDATIRATAAAPQRPVDVSVAPQTPAKAPNPNAEVQSALLGAPLEAVEDVGRVLAQVESLYLQDLESGRSGIEIADRLTASLRHARSIIVGRWSVDGFDAQVLFEYHMGLLLDRQVATSFGRHLGIAAYALRTPEPSSAHEPESNS